MSVYSGKFATKKNENLVSPLEKKEFPEKISIVPKNTGWKFHKAYMVIPAFFSPKLAHFFSNLKEEVRSFRRSGLQSRLKRILFSDFCKN